MGAKTSHPGAEACEGDDKPGVPPHHPYSPDLAHADFYIFLKKKEQLANISFHWPTSPWLRIPSKATWNGPSESSPLKSSPPPTADD
jgi:hypothetical protein